MSRRAGPRRSVRGTAWRYAGAALAVAALLGGSLLTPAPAAAHTRSVSYSSWELTPSGARVRVRFPAREATRVPPETLATTGGPDPLARYVSQQVVLRAGGEACRPMAPPRRTRAAADWVALEWRLLCAASGAPREITSRLFLDVAPSHLHFARVRLPGGTERERVLSEEEPVWALGVVAPSGVAGAAPDAASSGAARGTTLAGYVALGIEHILSGWDHLAFVIALLLLAASLREVAALVTAFTLAHSVTLALATLGIVHPEAAVVEALIGFSIALVAAENAWLLSGRGRAIPEATTLALLGLALAAALGAGVLSPLTLGGLALFAGCHFALLRRSERPAALRSAVAFGFGLVHGFGFAGVLAEMSLPRARLAPALFGFNVGVELGQLAVVAVVWPLLRALARPATRGALRWVAGLGSAAICALGIFWFVTRTYA